MKIKVAEATNLQLDWLVASIEGFSDLRRNPHKFDNAWIVTPPRKEYGSVYLSDYSYSTDWAQGGPISEREKIQSSYIATFKEWGAFIQAFGGKGTGPTELIAKMRCYVTYKLGDEVEVPDELS